MTQDVYERLAKHFEAHPEGFPRTKSGIEMKILRKIFSEEQADIASQMKLTPSSAENIAERLGRDPEEMVAKLDEMEKKGQIFGVGPKENRLYSAHAFYFGVYQWQVEHLDKELVEMYKQYCEEALTEELEKMDPKVMRVLPMNVGIDAQTQILPHDNVRKLLEESESFRHADCICRKEARILGKGCDHMKEGCLFFSPMEGAFDAFPFGSHITKEEALKVVDEAAKQGLVHTTYNYADDLFNNICNCCSCACLSMVNIVESNRILARSDFFARIDPELCETCGDCVDACHVKAIDKGEQASSVNRERCIGCGVCVSACSKDAVSMAPKPEDQRATPPSTMTDWMLERAEQRGISIEEIL
jgi:electron transport complex protein RnfB